MSIAALFTADKMWKQYKCPYIYEWIKKMWNILKVEYYTAFKKGSSDTCGNMEEP